MNSINDWRGAPRNTKFLELAQSVSDYDNRAVVAQVAEAKKTGTFNDVCMEEIKMINKHIFLSPHFGENLVLLHDAAGGQKLSGNTYADMELFAENEFRCVCIGILKELRKERTFSSDVEEVIDRFKGFSVMTVEGKTAAAIKTGIEDKFSQLKQLQGYEEIDFTRGGVEKEVSDVVNGHQFKTLRSKLALLNHLQMVDDGEEGILRNNLHNLFQAINKAKMDASESPVSDSGSGF